MRFIVNPRHYLLTSEGFVPIHQIVKNVKNTIVKSYLFELRMFNEQDTPSLTVSKIEYGHIWVDKNVNLSDKKKLQGFKIFNNCLLVEAVENCCLMDAKTGNFVDMDRVSPGFSFVTIIKHMVVDLSFDKYCYNTVESPIVLKTVDLPSVTISTDEVGSTTITLFNKKFTQV